MDCGSGTTLEDPTTTVAFFQVFTACVQGQVKEMEKPLARVCMS